MPVVPRLRNHSLEKYLGSNMDFGSEIIKIKCNDHKNNNTSVSDCFRYNKI